MIANLIALRHLLCFFFQLNHARQRNTHSNVSFHKTAAENLSMFQDHSVDLVTVGTALHGFRKDAFYKEVKRILHPDTGKIFWHTCGY